MLIPNLSPLRAQITHGNPAYLKWIDESVPECGK